MKKLLGGLAVFMFVLVIMAGSASAAGVSFVNPTLITNVVNNILATVLGVILKHMVIIGVLVALSIVIQMLKPSEAEIAFDQEQDDYTDYAQKLDRKAAFRDRYDAEHYEGTSIADDYGINYDD